MQANYEGIRLRRFPERSVELFVSNDGGTDTAPADGEVWVALDPPQFRKFMGTVVDRMERFNKRETTIKLK